MSLSLPSGERITLMGMASFAQFLKQPIWWIDQLNRTGKASNKNTGLTRNDPILTWNGGGGVIDRMGGTLFPMLDSGPSVGPQSVGFNFLSGSPADGSDPISFRPTQIQSTVVRFNGLLDSHNLQGSGALAGVVPKNRAAGTKLQANLSAVPGAAVGQCLVNNTRVARSIVYSSLGGGVFELCQPQTITDNWPTSSDPVPIDTYQTGDNFSLFNLDQLDVVRLESDVAQWDAAQAAQFITMTSLGVMNPTPGTPSSFNPLYLGDHCTIVNCWIQRRIHGARPFRDHIPNFIGSLCSGGIRYGEADLPGVSQALVINGGAIASSELFGAVLNQDVIVFGTARMHDSELSLVCLDTGASLLVAEESQVADFGDGVAVWGPGALGSVGRGRIFLNGTTAVAALLQTGGLTINGLTTAFTATRANPSVINGNVAITNANIDANVSGLWVPGGGSIAAFG